MREYREYFRPDENRPPLWLGLSSVTHALIVANIFLFLAFVIGAFLIRPYLPGTSDAPADYARKVLETLGLVPTAALGGGRAWQFLTYGFIHDPRAFPIHLVFNMLVLYFFGREVETLYGPRRFTVLYFAASLFAGLVACLDYQPSVICGASAAVYAVMVAYACHYPRRRILFFFLFPLEVWALVGLLIGLDVAAYLKAGEPAGLAHLAGALFGWLFYRLEPRFGIYLDRFERHVAKQEHEHEEEIEARLDTLLEKISRDGMSALSKKERDFLKRASAHYQNKV